MLRKFRNLFKKKITEKNSSEEGGLLSSFLCPLMKVGLPLMRNVLTSLA